MGKPCTELRECFRGFHGFGFGLSWVGIVVPKLPPRWRPTTHHEFAISIYLQNNEIGAGEHQFQRFRWSEISGNCVGLLTLHLFHHEEYRAVGSRSKQPQGRGSVAAREVVGPPWLAP